MSVTGLNFFFDIWMCVYIHIVCVFVYSTWSVCGFVSLAAMYLLDDIFAVLHILPRTLLPSEFQKSHLPRSNPLINTHTLKILIFLRSKRRLCNPSRPSSVSYLLCFQRELCSKPRCSQNISETLHGRLCIMNSLANTALKYILMHEF